MNHSTPPKNRLLGALSPETYARLAPSIQYRAFELFEVLAEAEGPIPYAYFPVDAIISVVRPANGVLVEAGTIGCEGMGGFSPLLGAEWATSMMNIQLAGTCGFIEMDALKAVYEDSPELRSLVGRFILTFFDQVGQAAACNVRHSVQQRCAKWLLMTRDRVDSNTFGLKQEVLAQMLGVRRVAVSAAAAALQRRELISYSRGVITFVDRAGLVSEACECYEINRSHLKKLLGAGNSIGGDVVS